MRIEIDTTTKELTLHQADESKTIGLYSREALPILAELWLKTEWSTERWRAFSWAGVQMLQLPEDTIRLHEAIWRLQPDLIIETGVYRGGGSIFLAGLCKLMDRGRVICVELDLRPEAKETLTQHPLSQYITCLEGSSTAPEILSRIKPAIDAAECCMVILDSNHSADHVFAELECYGAMLKPGSIMLATDGVMERLWDTPLGQPDWSSNNPVAAVKRFLRHRGDRFELIAPPAMYGEAQFDLPELTYFPHGWLRAKSS
jgi:cephalosporin hydroxylase